MPGTTRGSAAVRLPRAQADAVLTEEIRRIHAKSRQTYGVPRVHAALGLTGRRVSRKRVARLMRAAGLRGCGRRRRVRTTVSDPTATPAPNLVQRQFIAEQPNRLWITDLTYLRTAEGWLYLAAMLDAHSRRVVGWAMADHLRTELALEALTMALRERRPRSGELVHHSDRGSQYTSGAYQAVLAAHGIRCSMSRKGNCLDNAMAESFFATLKRELMPEDGMVDQEGGTSGGVRMDRGLLQSAASALRHRLPNAGRIRIFEGATPGSIAIDCLRKRGSLTHRR